MAADEPPYLTIGTDVSAKYKGAFCEAKVKKVNRSVKCKVTFKNNLGSFMITDEQIRGSLRIGADIEALHPEKKQYLDAVINKMQDYSQYTVVFDDGDETTLRRTSLCLKSGRHFAESPTLDQFPLTNPEHFGSPVLGRSKGKRKRRATMNSATLDYYSSDEDPVPRKSRLSRGKEKEKEKEKDPDVGKVVCVDYGDRRKKDNWYPGLITTTGQMALRINTKEEYVIRSFKDGKYYQVPKKDTREFNRDISRRIENNSLRQAVEKAALYLEKGVLPLQWAKTLYVGMETAFNEEESHDTDSDSSDDEPSEEKDRFVAQLYKFMDERGTPINKAPTVGSRDLNLYKLFKVVHKMHGYNRVTNQNKWKIVYSKMGFPMSNPSGSNQIKLAYKRYLHSFEDFYRKLGCTMNSRSTRGMHRSDRNFITTRNKSRDVSSPKAQKEKDKSNESKPEQRNRHNSEKKDNKVKIEGSPKSEEKTKIADKKKPETKKVEEKDDKTKVKKEENNKPRLVRSQSLNKDKKDTKDTDNTDDKKDTRHERARTREDAKREKTESPEKKKETRSSVKSEQEKKDKDDKKPESSIKEISKKDEKLKCSKPEKPLPDDKKDSHVNVKKIEKLPKEKNEKSQIIEHIVVKDKKDIKKEKITEVKKEKVDNVKVIEKCDDSPTNKDKKDRLREIKTTRISNFLKSAKVKEEKPEPEPSKEKKILRDLSSLKDDNFVTILCDIKQEKDKSDDEKDSHDYASVSGRSANDDDDFSPGKNIRNKRLTPDGKDDTKSLEGISDESDEEIIGTTDNKDKNIEIGDRVKVKYGRGRTQKVYEAKVLKMEMESGEKKFYVHYAGWNTRYDEWVRKNSIVENISEHNRAVRKQKKDAKEAPSPSPSKKSERGRLSGVSPIPKLHRKNSTSSTNSSTVSTCRTTRSDKSSLHSAQTSGGLQLRKRVCKKSITSAFTDTSQDSESDEDSTLMDVDDDDIDMENTAKKMKEDDEEIFSNEEDIDLESSKKQMKKEPEEIEEEPIAMKQESNVLDIPKVDTKKYHYLEGKKLRVELENCAIRLDKPSQIALKHVKQEKVQKNPTTATDKEELLKKINIDITVKKEIPENKSFTERKEISIIDCQMEEKVKKPMNICEETTSKKDSKKNGSNFSESFKEKSLFQEKEDKDILPKENLLKKELDTNKKEIDMSKEKCLNKSKEIPKEIDLVEKEENSFNKNNAVEEKLSEKIYNKIELDKKFISKEHEKKELVVKEPNKKDYNKKVEDIKEQEKKDITDNKQHEKKDVDKKCISLATEFLEKQTILKKKELFEKTVPPKKDVPEKDIPDILIPVLKKADEVVVEKRQSISELIEKRYVELIEKQPPTTSNASLLQPKIFDEPKKLLDEKMPRLMTYMGSYKDSPFTSNITPTASSLPMFQNSSILLPKNKENKDIPSDSKIVTTSHSIIDSVTEKVSSPETVQSKPIIEPPVRKRSYFPMFNFNSTNPNFTASPVTTTEKKSTPIKNLQNLPETSVIDQNVSKIIVSDKPPLFRNKISNKESLVDEKSLNFAVKKDIPINPSIDILSKVALSSEKATTSSTNINLKPETSNFQKQDIKAKNVDLKWKTSINEEKPKISLEHNLPAICKPKPMEIRPKSPQYDKFPSTFSKPEKFKPSALDTSPLESMKKPEVNIVKPTDVKVLNLQRKAPTTDFDALKNLTYPKKESPSVSAKTEEKESSSYASVIAFASSTTPTVLPPFEISKNIKEENSSFTKIDTSIQEKVTLLGKIEISEDKKPITLIKEEEKVDKIEGKKTVETLDFGESIHKGLTELSIGEKGKELPKEQNLSSTNNSTVCNVFLNMSVDKSTKDSKELFTPQKSMPDVKEEKVLPSSKSHSPIEGTQNVSSLSVENVEKLTNSLEKESSGISSFYKKEMKKKKSKTSKKASDSFEKEDRPKEGRLKYKKKSKFDPDDPSRLRDGEMKSKTKKFKKNKNKKRLLKGDESSYDLSSKLGESGSKSSFLEKIKKKEKRKREEKKFLKTEMKSEEHMDFKSDVSKKDKKKGKKNKDKMSGDKKMDPSEKKVKKKKKSHIEDNIDSDSDKEPQIRLGEKKKKKDKKKMKPKDTSSSDDAAENRLLIDEDNATFTPVRDLQEKREKIDDPDMSFLLCEEKVPASPVDVHSIPDDTTGSSSLDDNSNNQSPSSDEERIQPVNLDVYPRSANIEMLSAVNKRNVEASAVLDNTPPTTPSSSPASMPSSSPSLDREPFLHYTESTQSGRESCERDIDSFHCGLNRTEITESEEYRAAATLAFAVCQSVGEKTESYRTPPLKRQKSELDEFSPSKRRKKNKRALSGSDISKMGNTKYKAASRSPRGESCDTYDSSNASILTTGSPPHGSSSVTHFASFSHHSSSQPSNSTDSTSCAKSSKANFYIPLHEYKDPEKRIAVLQERMSDLKKLYASLKAEVAMIDRRRKKARKKIREAAAASAVVSTPAHGDEGDNCS